jgi:hypothetical protein
MLNYIKSLSLIIFLALPLLACDNDSNGSSTLTKTEAQQLREQFGAASEFFTDEGMQALLDFADTGNPVILLQLISVTDDVGFANYEVEAAQVWETVGGQKRFASQVFAQLIGERPLPVVRALSFPNVTMLLDAINTQAFTAAMDTLAAATDDHAWVVGVEDILPFEPSGSYFDPALQGLDSEAAQALLNSQGNESNFDTDTSVIVDMIVSDDPSPFFMVNLIDFYEQANYTDGRDSDLTGMEANDIYGQAIFPTLMAYNSLPELLMPISATLTVEPADWEQAAIVRYSSRDGFLNAFPLNPNSGDALIHKEAGVENTLVYASSVLDESLPTPTSGLLYNFRYCEVLLGKSDGERVRADVYNSMPLSTCPQDEWDALDAEAIADEFDADFAVLNGIRFWVLDFIQSNVPLDPDSPTANFSGINMRLAASVLLPEGLSPGDEVGYQVARVSRDTVFFYNAGRQVYELEDPEGIRYRMQSFSRVVDKELQLEDLQTLGQRLNLPPGWSFSTRVLEETLELLTVDGIAEVVTDDLNNTYQRIP